MSLALAIDTSSFNTYVALADSARGVIAARVSAAGESHNEQLASMVDELLNDAQCSARSVERLLYGMGPGSFTGLRIGAAFISGMVSALRIPMYAVDSLFAAAANVVPSSSAVSVAIATDARRGEVFFGHFNIRAMTVLRRPSIMSIADARTYLESQGSPALYTDCPAAFENGRDLGSLDRARGLVALWASQPGLFQGWEAATIGGFEPLYLRAVSARTIEERQKKPS